MESELLRRREAEKFLRIRRESFRKLMVSGELSRGIPISPKVRAWKKSELIDFIKRKEESSYAVEC